MRTAQFSFIIKHGSKHHDSHKSATVSSFFRHHFNSALPSPASRRRVGDEGSSAPTNTNSMSEDTQDSAFKTQYRRSIALLIQQLDAFRDTSKLLTKYWRQAQSFVMPSQKH